MNSEQIERLAMDLASGQMNEDMEALFRDYLARHPEQRILADQFAGLCRRCRTGFQVQASPAAPMKVQPSQLAQGDRFFSVCRYAAVLVFGVLFGAGFIRMAPSSATPDTAQSVYKPAETKSPSAFAYAIEEGFWKEKAEAMKRQGLWTVDTKTQEDESFWGRYRKELTHVHKETD